MHVPLYKNVLFQLTVFNYKPTSIVFDYSICFSSSFFFNFVFFMGKYFQDFGMQLISFSLRSNGNWSIFSLVKKGRKNLWLSGRGKVSLPLSPGFEPQHARLSPPWCLTCLLGLQGVQWVRGLVVARVSWSGHPGLPKKKRAEK